MNSDQERPIPVQWKSWDEVPLVLTVQQVSDLLQVHPNTLKKWIRAGRLPAMKAGRDYRIRREIIDQLTLGELPNFQVSEEEEEDDV